MQQKPSSQRILLAFGVVTLLCFIAASIFVTRGNDFAAMQPSASFQPPLTNGYILQAQLPSSVYDYTIARIDDYLHTNNLQTSSMRVRGGLLTSPDTYDFSLMIEPQEQTLAVSLKVDNFDSIISTAVLINGQLQNPTVFAQTPSGTQFSGIDQLVNAGVTSLQARALEDAFQKYAPTANAVTVNPDSIASPTANQDNSTTIYTFKVVIDDGSFNATLRCPDINQAELVLANQSGKRVFDSGVLSSE